MPPDHDETFADALRQQRLSDYGHGRTGHNAHPARDVPPPRRGRGRPHHHVAMGITDVPLGADPMEAIVETLLSRHEARLFLAALAIGREQPGGAIFETSDCVYYPSDACLGNLLAYARVIECTQPACSGEGYTDQDSEAPPEPFSLSAVNGGTGDYPGPVAISALTGIPLREVRREADGPMSPVSVRHVLLRLGYRASYDMRLIRDTEDSATLRPPTFGQWVRDGYAGDGAAHLVGLSGHWVAVADGQAVDNGKVFGATPCALTEGLSCPRSLKGFAWIRVIGRAG